MATSDIPPKGPEFQFDEAGYRSRLADEYKMLQDKIDKIGAFGFTIKGWSVTAVVAASVASGTAKSLVAVVTISVGVAIMLIFFFHFEVQQVKLSRLFGSRAMRIEVALERINRRSGMTARKFLQTPYLAHEIALRGMAKSATHRPPQSPSTKCLVDHFGPTYRLWRQSDFLFYLVLFVASFAPIVAFNWQSRSTTSTAAQTISEPRSSGGSAGMVPK